MSAPAARMRWWGWGVDADAMQLPPDADAMIRGGLGAEAAPPRVELDAIRLPESRLDGGLRQRFASIVGAENVRDDLATRVSHAAGRSYPDLVRLRSGQVTGPDAVVYPGNHGEVLALLQACSESGVAVVPFGGGTSVVGGVDPNAGSFAAVVAVDLARMAGLIDVDEVSLLARVAPGTTGPELEAALGGHGLTLGHLPQSWEYITIGGAVATRSAGQASTGYGRIDKQVLGLRLAAPAGEIDVRVQPGTAGPTPAMRELLVGSEGTLGIITAAVLKLFPRPRTQVVAFVGCASPHAALGLFESLRRTMGDELTAFEYLPRFALEIVLRHAAGAVRPLGGDHAAYALIEVSSPDPELDLRHQLEKVLEGAFEGGTIEDATIATSEAQNAALWHLRESLSDVQGLEGGSIKHDVAVPVSDVADFIVAASTACEEALPGVRVCAFGHFGDGNIHFNLTQPVDMEKSLFLAQWERFNRIVHDIVHAMNGSISAEHGVGLIKRDELARYKDPVALDLMRTLKQALDPQNILNPGKVVALEGDLPPALPVARKA